MKTATVIFGALDHHNFGFLVALFHRSWQDQRGDYARQVKHHFAVKAALDEQTMHAVVGPVA
jgi:hypothetical protein